MRGLGLGGGAIYSISNVYAPTQDRPKEQMDILGKLEGFLSEMDTTNLILAGDFNCLLEPALDKNSSTPCQPSSTAVRDKLNLVMEEWSVTDVWRVRNPSTRAYTFRRGHYASRLDYFLVSSHLADVVTSIKHEILVHSDHAMVLLSLRPKLNNNRGPGFWKFDPALLANQEFLADMTSFLSSWSPPQEISNPNSIWDWLKCEIRNHIRLFTKKLHSNEKQHLTTLTKELERLHQSADAGGAQHVMENP